MRWRKGDWLCVNNTDPKFRKKLGETIIKKLRTSHWLNFQKLARKTHKNTGHESNENIGDIQCVPLIRHDWRIFQSLLPPHFIIELARGAELHCCNSDSTLYIRTGHGKETELLMVCNEGIIFQNFSLHRVFFQNCNIFFKIKSSFVSQCVPSEPTEGWSDK